MREARQQWARLGFPLGMVLAITPKGPRFIQREECSVILRREGVGVFIPVP
jgi:hypothetical protein